MDALVEETVNANQSSPLSQTESRIRSNGSVVFAPSVSHAVSTSSPGGSLTAVTSGGTVSIVQVALPNNVQSVIQPGPNQPSQQQSQQPSVIQTAPLQPVQLQFEESLFHENHLHNKLAKNVILLNKAGSVIHSTEADPRAHPIQLIQAKGTTLDNGDVIVAGEDSKKRREILARRPSYRKILNDLSSEPSPLSVTADLKDDNTSNEASSQESDSGTIIVGTSQYHTGLLKGGEVASPPSWNHFVVPASALQLGSQDVQSLTGGGGGTLVQYAAAQGQEGGQYFVPVTVAELGNCQIRTAGNNPNSATSSPLLTSPSSSIPEETSRKREIRLLKNREAAKECRRKKKEYIKCLENRVAVLENQNKALIDELKSLKELYCRKE